jgi:sec-independent protein translocase protein TatB
MFEVGFSEIVLIFVIALVVLGPEKLPKLARQLGNWTGRARAIARQLRQQLDTEIDLTDTATPARPRASTPAPPLEPQSSPPPDSHE